MTIGVQTCNCMTDIKPRWSKDKPLIFACERCGRCVPGYERLWLQREKEDKKKG